MANTFGAFGLVVEETEAELYLLYDDDILASLDISSLVPDSVQDDKIIEKELKVMECLPSPVIRATAIGPNRVKYVSEFN